ncbi:Hypothetical protein I5071_14360 [Sandaracinus amylolyticus]|nr:Hypothetical protein I5071_14360 [Sandaracinus amylolyticus]
MLDRAGRCTGSIRSVPWIDVVVHRTDLVGARDRSGRCTGPDPSRDHRRRHRRWDRIPSVHHRASPAWWDRIPSVHHRASLAWWDRIPSDHHRGPHRITTEDPTGSPPRIPRTVTSREMGGIGLESDDFGELVDDEMVEDRSRSGDRERVLRRDRDRSRGIRAASGRISTTESRRGPQRRAEFSDLCGSPWPSAVNSDRARGDLERARCLAMANRENDHVVRRRDRCRARAVDRASRPYAVAIAVALAPSLAHHVHPPSRSLPRSCRRSRLSTSRPRRAHRASIPARSAHTRAARCYARASGPRRSADRSRAISPPPSEAAEPRYRARGGGSGGRRDGGSQRPTTD